MYLDLHDVGESEVRRPVLYRGVASGVIDRDDVLMDTLDIRGELMAMTACGIRRGQEAP
jgi:hypothetical protein